MLSQVPLARTRSKADQSTAGSLQTAVTASTPDVGQGGPQQGPVVVQVGVAGARGGGQPRPGPARRRGGAAQLPMGKWQATWWPGAISRISGTSSAQRASARGQRVRKRQPDGGLMGLGRLPGQGGRQRGASGSGSTAEASSAAV